MRIRSVSIDGYGRFAKVGLEFAPGLQVVIGPNEQGKTTLRSFIGDMLYGQRAGGRADVYDEAKELRLPWNNPDCYGGRLSYELASGTVIEVVRNFDPERESVQVFDRTQNRDITNEFDLLRNHELNFAQTHLGLPKEVFLSTATISHFSLEGLGDHDALEQIREKLLSLADTGEEHVSAEETLELLKDRLQGIGQPGARTRPLPAAQTRLLELRDELRRETRRQETLDALGEQRRVLLQETLELRKRRLALEEDIRAVEAHLRLDRVREAETLVARISTATQHCFALGAVREFPLQQLPEVQRAQSRVEKARQQAERTRSERKALSKQLDDEMHVIGPDAGREFSDLPETLEEQLNEAASEVQKIAEKERELAEFANVSEQRLRQTQQLLSELPDFSRVAADPMDYVTQLANSFEVARRERDVERRELEAINNDIRKRQEAIATAHGLFKGRNDLPELTREHELQKRLLEEKQAQGQSKLLSLQSTQAELSEQNPQFFVIFVGCSIGLIVIAALYFYFQQYSFLIGWVVVLTAALYFGLQYKFDRRRLEQLAQELEATRQELESMDLGGDAVQTEVRNFLEKSGCETVRELEAMFDRYREASLDLTARVAVLREQEAKTQEAEERIPLLLERLRDTFEKIGEHLQREEDVPDAATRAITRYQQYREGKRQLTECRSVLDRYQTELRRVGEQRAEAETRMRGAEEALRGFLRKQGYEEERKHESAIAALRSYRTRVSRTREHRGRVEVLEDRLHALERQLKTEELELEKHEQELARLLAHAGVSSVEQFNTMADQAREYQEIWNKRALLEEQLNAILRGEDLQSLKRSAEATGALAPRPRQSVEQLRAELEAVAKTIDDRMAEEHQLHLSLTESASSGRPLVEIEEELAWTEKCVRQWGFEYEATTQAMALIDEIARDKHARIAPKLAERASRHLAEITAGAYDDLRIGRDFTISVRVPQTRKMKAPEKSLSKGTVDQIYLALRLSLVQSLSENGEPVPMLLDDPFANYDDARLENTLRLVAQMGKQQQILLFTCREDVVRAAQQVEVPILRL